ncbi:MAG: nucleotidyltransferase family protein [Verrucomicrobia bacterium]|nr:MAG: nucleotidyltransferase family protein [Verrucomicrobiota bacterium]
MAFLNENYLKLQAGYLFPEIARQLKESAALIVPNPDWRNGIASSIRCGVERVAEFNVSGGVLLTCDQPLVDCEAIRGLISLADRTHKPIAAAEYCDTVGIPALFARKFFPELLLLRGASGAKRIILANLDKVVRYTLPEAAIDIDTEADAAELKLEATDGES